MFLSRGGVVGRRGVSPDSGPGAATAATEGIITNAIPGFLLEGESHADPDAVTDPDALSYTDANPDSHPDSLSDADADAHADAHTHPFPDPDAHTHP